MKAQGSEVPKQHANQFTPSLLCDPFMFGKLHHAEAGAFSFINMSKFEQWFQKSGFPESERAHLEVAFNYALATGMKFVKEEGK